MKAIISIAIRSLLVLASCLAVTGCTPSKPVNNPAVPAAALNNRLAQANLAQQASTGGPATGPLRASPANPRYFSDPGGKIVYLTGSHTWSNLQDNGGSNPPPAFDYQAYLDFLKKNNHNFFRLWAWEQSRWTLETGDDNYWFSPLPYQRSGPGNALDGQPKFDLNRFNQAYFDRMRQRVSQAGQQGIYVSVMLFDGWSITGNKGGLAKNNPWKGHPFNQANNINGVNGDPNNNNNGDEIQRLSIPAVTAYQEAYVRKVIDTVGDLDNVLYEISNESNGGAAEVAWQYHMINLVHAYEQGKAKQHPAGLTALYPNGFNGDLTTSPADWISPAGGIDNPDPDAGLANGKYKVVLADTDHLCGICGNTAWVWKSFTRGQNPVFMDGYDGAGYGVGGEYFNFNDPNWVNLRLNLGFARSYAGRMNLAAMQPRGELASSGYALANPAASGAEYLAYLPEGGTVNLDLSAASGPLMVEWFKPADGTTYSGEMVTGGSRQSFKAPFSGDAVLYVWQKSATNNPPPTTAAPPDC